MRTIMGRKLPPKKVPSPPALVWSVPTLKTLCIKKIARHLRTEKSQLRYDDDLGKLDSLKNSKLPVEINNAIFAEANRKKRRTLTIAFKGVQITEVDLTDKRDLTDGRVARFLSKLVLKKLKVGTKSCQWNDEDPEDNIRNNDIYDDDDEHEDYSEDESEDEDVDDGKADDGKADDNNVEPNINEHRCIRFMEAAFPKPQNRESLRVLEFEKHPDETRDFFVEVNDVLQYFPCLDTLISRNMSVEEEINEVVKERRKLKHLDLSGGCSLDIDKIVENLPALEVLMLRDVKLEGKIEKIFELKNLQILDVSNCFTNEQVLSFLSADVPTHPSRLTFLDWSFNRSTEDVIQKLLQFAPNLTTIGLLDCDLRAKNFPGKSLHFLNVETMDSTLLALETYSKMENKTMLEKLLDRMQNLPDQVLEDHRMSQVLDEILNILEELQEVNHYFSTRVTERCVLVMKRLYSWYNQKRGKRVACPFSPPQVKKMFSLLTHAYRKFSGNGVYKWTNSVTRCLLYVMGLPNVFNTANVNQKTQLLLAMHYYYRHYLVDEEEDVLVVDLSQRIMEECLSFENCSASIFEKFHPCYEMSLVRKLWISFTPFTDRIAKFLSIFLKFAKTFVDVKQFDDDAHKEWEILAKHAEDGLKEEITQFVLLLRPPIQKKRKRKIVTCYGIKPIPHSVWIAQQGKTDHSVSNDIVLRFRV